MLEFNLFGIPYVSKKLERPFLRLVLSMIAANTREPADAYLWLHIKWQHSIAVLDLASHAGVFRGASFSH